MADTMGEALKAAIERQEMQRKAAKGAVSTAMAGRTPEQPQEGEKEVS